MAPDALIENDSEYFSAEDSDFAPEAVQQYASGDSSDSESESEAANNNSTQKQKPAKRKRGKDVITEEAEDVGYENSGDEAIIENGLRRQRKKGRKGKEDDDDEGGEGGFVKTRRMAALVTEEKKPLASTETATVDVEALWANMTSTPIKPITTQQPLDQAAVEVDEAIENAILKDDGSNDASAQLNNEADENMVMIQRTYNFAGKVHMEEKLVPRDSAEAKLWLESQTSETGKSLTTSTGPNITKPLRPPKKARRSIFEPITENPSQRTDLRFGVSAMARKPAMVSGGIQAKKLNTVEKSKMDWAGYVDKEGIKDELETAGKAKGSYLDQKEFLARVEEKRDEEARKARLKGV